MEKVRNVNEAAAARIAAQQAPQATAPTPLCSVAGPGSALAEPSSSQTSISSHQLTEDEDDEYGDGGFDDSILSQIDLLV